METRETTTTRGGTDPSSPPSWQEGTTGTMMMEDDEHDAKTAVVKNSYSTSSPHIEGGGEKGVATVTEATRTTGIKHECMSSSSSSNSSPSMNSHGNRSHNNGIHSQESKSSKNIKQDVVPNNRDGVFRRRPPPPPPGEVAARAIGGGPGQGDHMIQYHYESNKRPSVYDSPQLAHPHRHVMIKSSSTTTPLAHDYNKYHHHHHGQGHRPDHQPSHPYPPYSGTTSHSSSSEVSRNSSNNYYHHHDTNIGDRHHRERHLHQQHHPSYPSSINPVTSSDGTHHTTSTPGRMPSSPHLTYDGLPLEPSPPPPPPFLQPTPGRGGDKPIDYSVEHHRQGYHHHHYHPNSPPSRGLGGDHGHEYYGRHDQHPPHPHPFPPRTTSGFIGSENNLHHSSPPPQRRMMTPSPFPKPPPPPPYLPHIGDTTLQPPYPPIDGTSGGVHHEGYSTYHYQHHHQHPYPHAHPPHLYPYPYSPYHLPSPYLPRMEYITKIKKSDVLSGRGGATNSHSGNKAFRKLVKEYQELYMKAKKRDKPGVAAMLVEKIRENGGRFLRRVGEGNTTDSKGHVLWVDIGDERAKEKTCQALREGAPERRRKRKTADATNTPSSGASNDENDMEYTNRNNDRKEPSDDGRLLTSSSSADRSNSSPSGGSGDYRDDRTERIHHASSWSSSSRIQQHDANYHHHHGVDPNVGGIAHHNHLHHNPEMSRMEDKKSMMIRPSPNLLRQKHLPVESISIDQLNDDQREIYLRDFCPPDPTIRRANSTTHQYVYASQHQNMYGTAGDGPPSSSSAAVGNKTSTDGPWPIVRV